MFSILYSLLNFFSPSSFNIDVSFQTVTGDVESARAHLTGSQLIEVIVVFLILLSFFIIVYLSLYYFQSPEEDKDYL
jgi:hypothetical protein